jgi:hypothetical protein
MREIKFRARYPFSNTWAYFTACQGHAHLSIDKSTVSQFTGLRDKNSNEIYEGDVLSDGPERGGLFAVEWAYACWQLRATEESKFIAYPNFHSQAANMVVIGNIYENPEFLEKGTENGK